MRWQPILRCHLPILICEQIAYRAYHITVWHHHAITLSVRFVIVLLCFLVVFEFWSNYCVQIIVQHHSSCQEGSLPSSLVWHVCMHACAYVHVCQFMCRCAVHCGVRASTSKHRPQGCSAEPRTSAVNLQ